MTDIGTSQIRGDLAPTGRLRAAINRGNTILVQTDAVTGEPSGIAVDLAREVARHLDVALDLIVYEAAGKMFEAVKRDEWDVTFLAIDPVRAADIEFTAPYVVIEGAYVVRANSKIAAIEDIDRADITISVARGSAYDLHLSRAIKDATLLRSPTATESFDLFMTKGVEVFAGVRQALLTLMQDHPGLRMIDPPFMTIRQAMGTRKGRLIGAAYLTSFIADMKASGFVAAALERAGQRSAKVAP
jgi:polar amino acid transport system substrate-binding protein